MDEKTIYQDGQTSYNFFFVIFKEIKIYTVYIKVDYSNIDHWVNKVKWAAANQYEWEMNKSKSEFIEKKINLVI